MLYGVSDLAGLASARRLGVFIRIRRLQVLTDSDGGVDAARQSSEKTGS